MGKIRPEDSREDLPKREEPEEPLHHSELDAAAGRLAFLAEATKILSSTLDIDLTFRSLVRLIVPYLADWCTVCVLEEEGMIRRVAVAHVNPKKEEFARELERRFPPEQGGDFVPKVLRTGLPELIPEFKTSIQEAFQNYTKNDEFVNVIDVLGIESLMIVPLIARGRIMGALSFIMSESDRTYNKSDLLLAEELARRAALALDNARLYHESLAHAERLELESRVREQFISTLTHDIRSPLTAVKMSAQMILRMPNEPYKCQSLASRIVDSINRADRMIRDLLDANTVRAGQRLGIHIEEVNLQEVCADLVNELATIHGDRFVIDSSSKVTGFWSRAELHRAIENLVLNGIKFGSAHDPIRIGLNDKGHCMEISVNNRGSLLSPEDQVKIFWPFNRTKAAQASGKKGWGLGLTLVRGIAEAHGGRVYVRSNEESGTTFFISLPYDSRPFQPVNP